MDEPLDLTDLQRMADAARLARVRLIGRQIENRTYDEEGPLAVVAHRIAEELRGKSISDLS